MEYSKYQLGVFDGMANDSSNLIVEAVAGSGKSFTLEHATRRLDECLKILVVAFNKDIVTALKPRITHMGAEVVTLNAFGWRILRNRFRGLREVNANKFSDIYKMSFDMYDNHERGLFYKTKGMAVRLTDLFRANLNTSPTISEIREYCDEFGLELPQKGNDLSKFFEAVIESYFSAIRNNNVVDFRDQVFLPIYLNLPVPQYDIVLVDEAQDLDRSQTELILRTGARIIAVGDPNQAIYGFRGAMADAMQVIQERIKAKKLPLSICYRCPKAVVEEAKKIVPQIEAHPDAPEGKVERINIDAYRKDVQSNDFVLCRCVAPLVSECFHFIRLGRKAIVKGRDIGEQLLSFIDVICPKPSTPIPEFLDILSKYHLEQLNRLQRSDKEDLIIALNDKVETVKIIAETCNVIDDISGRVKSIFTDTIAGIVFMTIHKAKGLEATKVFILEPQLLPHPAAKKDWQKKQEMNLKYVAITRAKFDRDFGQDGALYWVQGKIAGHKSQAQLEAVPVMEPMKPTLDEVLEEQMLEDMQPEF